VDQSGFRKVNLKDEENIFEATIRLKKKKRKKMDRIDGFKCHLFLFPPTMHCDVKAVQILYDCF